MLRMATTVLLLLVLHLLVPPAAAQPQRPVARPGCRDTCGNITIPYPFGIGAGCYRDDGIWGFQLKCYDSGPSPPRLTIIHGQGVYFGDDEYIFRDYRLAALSLADGEATSYINATRMCYNSTDGSRNDDGMYDSTTDMILLNSTYLLSSTKNFLVTLGCPSFGCFFSADGEYTSGCVSVCSSHSSGSSTDVGWCESTIASGSNFLQPLLNSVSEMPGVTAVTWSNISTSCRYVFLVEAEQLPVVRAKWNRTDDFEVPIVLDWAIRNVYSCSVARLNTTDFACRSTHSECFDVTKGYRCNCSRGYGGNPYLDNGCTDIDECQLKDEYPCHGICTNMPGEYTCQCIPGTTGDPSVENGCKCPKGYEGNPYLSGGCTDIDECQLKGEHTLCYGDCTNLQGNYTCQCPRGTSGNSTMKNGCQQVDEFTLALKVVIGVGMGVILLGSMFCGTCLALQKSNLMRTKKKFFEHNGGVILQQQMRSYGKGGATGGFKIFSTEELKKATNNFAADTILGRGGHGIVYKGVMADNSVVAIKKSKMMEEAEIKEFTREMLILSQINHRNIVKLLGCCLEVEVPMLVYEYVSNGILYQYIHGGKGLDVDTALDTRLRIGAESAEALAYMHTSASPPILHGDVKTANILLDESLTAKVTDFGASKLAPNDEAEVFATLVQGTCGYLDPEYLMTCQFTDKSDVYSFGVVLLELITRKKVLCFDGPEENRSLVSRFVMAVKAGRHEELMDDSVRKEMGPEALEEVTHLLMRCVSMNGYERPNMKEVAERLEALRRFQRQSWSQAGGGDCEDEDEDKSLLGRNQQHDVDYMFRPHDVIDLEGCSTYTYSS